MRLGNKEFINLFDEEDEVYQYLDQGEINGKWYYGIKMNNGLNILIYSDKTIEKDKYVCDCCDQEYFTSKKPKQCFKCKVKPALFNREFPSDFKAESDLGDIGSFWSKAYIKEWLENDFQVNKNDLYSEIKTIIDEFMDFDEHTYYSEVQACWVMGTYVFQLFYWFPHILFKAPSHSGKSKNARLLYEMSFRGYDLGASAGVSPAQIFRTIEGNRGTLFIDEYAKEKDSESQKLVNQLLNSSASRDSNIIRCVKIGDNWEVKKFPTFCPKIVANISGINATSLSRFITFQLMRFTSQEKGRKKAERPENKFIFEKIRNKMHILIMNDWEKIKNIERNLNVELSGRYEDNWRPILTIAKYVSDDLYNRVLSYVDKFDTFNISTSDNELTMFEMMRDMVPENDVFLKTKEISERISNSVDVDTKSLSRWVVCKLRQYNLRKERRHNGVGDIVSKPIISKLLDTYFQKRVVCVVNERVPLCEMLKINETKDKVIYENNVSSSKKTTQTTHNTSYTYNTLTTISTHIKEIIAKEFDNLGNGKA